jgi:hypothetical protein
VIKAMLKSVESKEEDKLEHIPDVLFDAYATGSGWEPRSPVNVTVAVDRLLRSFLDVDLEEKADTKVVPAVEATEKPAKEAKESEEQDEPEVDDYDHDEL